MNEVERLFLLTFALLFFIVAFVEMFTGSMIMAYFSMAVGWAILGYEKVTK